MCASIQNVCFLGLHMLTFTALLAGVVRGNVAGIGIGTETKTGTGGEAAAGSLCVHARALSLSFSFSFSLLRALVNSLTNSIADAPYLPVSPSQV